MPVPVSTTSMTTAGRSGEPPRADPGERPMPCPTGVTQRPHGRPVLVEGPMDVLAIAAADAGQQRFAAAAPGGTAVTRGHIQALAAVSDLSRGLVAALDPDAAGARATMRLWALLTEAGVTANARAASLPAGADPAETLTSRGREALVDALTTASTPLVDAVVAATIEDYASNDISTADIPTRVAALHRAAPFVAQTGRPEDVVRLVAYLADRLQLAHSAVTIAVTDAITDSTAMIDVPKAARLSTGTGVVHRSPRPACPGRPPTVR